MDLISEVDGETETLNEEGKQQKIKLIVETGKGKHSTLQSP